MSPAQNSDQVRTVGSLAGTRALVTGAAEGVGATTAERIVSLGGAVALADINRDKVHETAERIGAGATAVHLDVSDPGSWDEAVTEATEALGGIDALVNNAGVLHLGPLEDMEPESIERILSVNLLGPILGTRAVTPVLRGAGGGSIVNIASVAGLEGRNATVAYTSSKWGVRGLTKASAMELGRYGIRVNAVCPSMGNPEMFAPFLAEFDLEEFTLTSPRPALVVDGRAVDAEMADVAAAVTFLLSEEARVCTGTDLVVDVGWTVGTYVSGMPGHGRDSRPQAT